jgi:hypothetical protein
MLFGHPSPLVLLDANAIRNHFRPRARPADELARIRARALDAKRSERARFVMTQPLLWELTSIVGQDGRDRYDEALRFYTDLGHEWFIRAEHEREPLELRRRRPLLVSEVFQEAPAPRTIVDHCGAEDWIALQQRQLREAKDRERNDEARARSAVAQHSERHVGPAWRVQLGAELSGDEWDRNVSGMVRVEMRRAARRHRLRVAGWAWPRPKDVPTFWYGESFLAAKARHVFVESRRELTSNASLQDMPDVLDATHFRDAAYADVLVTNDAAFAKVARAARVPLRVVTFDEYADALFDL